MSLGDGVHSNIDRRKFLHGAGAGLAAGLLATSSPGAAQAPVAPESITHSSVMGPLSKRKSSTASHRTAGPSAISSS